MKILLNAGHGTAGPTFDAIAERLAELGAPLVFERIFHEPDGRFPQGIPNPLLPENRPATADAVRASGADFGVAWDGDFDLCFFFDHTGAFIDGEYVVGLLAEAFLAKDPGATIIHDPRIIWNTKDVVTKAGRRAVLTHTGHAFIKQAIRDENVIYGGEMSAPSLFPRLRLLRQWHDPLVAYCGIGEQARAAGGSCCASKSGISLFGGDQFHIGRPQGLHRESSSRI